MTVFGLDDRTIMRLAAGVRPQREGERRDSAEQSDSATGRDGRESMGLDAAMDVFARAAWTGITEPGDSMAGLVTGSLGPATALQALIDRWSIRKLHTAVLDAGVHDATDMGKGLATACERWLPRLGLASATMALEQANRVGAGLLVPDDELWPAGLNELELHAPLALWWRGSAGALAAMRRSIALVGARAATGYGEHVAMEASAGLVDRGFAIVSGAAYGIDGMAHRAALASKGSTTAFLAGGVDRFYPSGHDGLLTRIAETGVVASELPCGSAPTKWRFLQRNRLIAAASAATVVLEAGWRSGSLNTAGHAAALGRPLGAVPGPVTSAASAGCHRLIRDYDAICVTDAGQMAELVGLDTDTIAGLVDGAILEGQSYTTNETRILDALSTRSPRPLADIARRSGMAPDQVRSGLGALGLDGVVRERTSGWVRVQGSPN